MVHIHNEFYSAEKNNEILKLAGKVMKLENIVVSKAMQNMFSLQILAQRLYI